jgi:UDP-3-O-[3-hydroxymyristoyl] glucosamine N-acyltransferase
MPRTARPAALAELADFLGCPLEGAGAGSQTIHGLASLVQAAEDELVFARDASHLAALHASRARAVLAPQGLDVGARAALRSERPDFDFNRLIAEFAPPRRPPPGIAAGALVHPSARVDASATVAAGAIVGPACEVGARSQIGAGAVLAENVRVGVDCQLHIGALLREDTWLGDRVVVQPGVVLGGDGFGLVPAGDGRWESMAQRGRVVIEDDVEIGAQTSIDRATLDETRIRRGAKIDSLVQIAHNCDIGEDAVIVAQTGLAGGTVVGNGAVVMAQVGSAGHLRIGEGAFVGARTGLHHDVEDGARVYGSPQMEERTWHRISASLKRLPELFRRVRRLEKQIDGEAGARRPSGRDSGER